MSCPTAIFFAIISVGIYTVYGFSSRPFPHVFKEVLKFEPAFTNSNSSSSIIFESWSIGVGASLNHAGPTIISWRHLSFNGVTVGCKLIANYFQMIASTGNGVAVIQSLVGHSNGISTSTDTNRSQSVTVWKLFGRTFRNYFKSSKCFSYERYFGGHRCVCSTK